MSIKSRAQRIWKKVVAALAAAAVVVGAWLGINDAESQSTPVTDVLTWTHPTQYVDGTPLPVSHIAKTTIAWGATAGGPYPNLQDVVGTANTYTFTRAGDGAGRRCYRLATTVIAAQGGKQSDYGTEGCKVEAARPNPPSGLGVQ